jgi:hypothetical protein
MDLVRKIGIGIVMMVPTYVIGGLIWSVVPSWWVSLVWVIIMFFIAGGVISGKLLARVQRA